MHSSRKRLLLYGPPLAGKTTMLRAVAAHFSASVESVRTTDVGVGEVLLRVSLPRVNRTAVEIATIPGSTFHDGAWNALLERADDIVFVGDPQDHPAGIHERVLRALPEAQRAKIRCVVMSKMDLVERGMRISPRWGPLRESWRNVPEFQCRADVPWGYLMPLNLAGESR